MAITYAALVTKVRDWANRDEEVVSDDVIKDCLKYAADKAYRKLRVPPLENVAKYDNAALTAATSNATSTLSSITEIQLPYDLIEFIQIREVDSAGLTTRVFNERVDIRTFNDFRAEKYTGYNYWARQQNVIYLSPGFGQGALGNQGDAIELYYYRRLPALNAQYAVTVLNYNAGFLTTTGAGAGVNNSALLYFNSHTGASFQNGTAYATYSAAQAASPGGTVSSAYYQGTETPNWLRDENERIVLFGALGELFSFVQEDDQATKYLQLFMSEIAELNDEDARRTASGGNIQVNFNGRGLI